MWLEQVVSGVSGSQRILRFPGNQAAKQEEEDKPQGGGKEEEAPVEGFFVIITYYRQGWGTRLCSGPCGRPR